MGIQSHNSPGRFRYRLPDTLIVSCLTGLILLWSQLLFAAYAPPANYILPDYRIVQVDSGQLILGTGDRMRVDDWKSWPDPVYVQEENFLRRSCDIENDRGLKVVGCNEQYLIRLVTNKPDYYDCEKSNSVKLVERSTGNAIPIDQGLSSCEEVIGIQYHSGWVWVLSHLQGDHGTYSGKGLWWIDPQTGKTESVTSAHGAWRDKWGDDLIYSFAFDNDNRSIWLTSQNGLHKYDIDRNDWESRYYHIYLDEGAQLRVALKNHRQPQDDLELYSHLIELHIPDKQGFVVAWKKSGEKTGQPPYVNEDLAPFYLSALKAMPQTSSGDYQFSTLVDLLINFDRDRYLPVFVEMIASIENPGRRSQLIRNLERYGYSIPDETFSGLHNEFLQALLDGQGSVYDLCGFYRAQKTDFMDIEPEMLVRAGPELSRVLQFCFSDLKSESMTEGYLNRFRRLYELGDVEARASLCDYLQRVEHFHLDKQFVRDIVTDLSQIDRRSHNLRGPLQRLLLNKIQDGKQAVYLARLPESDPGLSDTVTSLIYLLQRRYAFPELTIYWQEKQAEQIGACRRSYPGETPEAFQARCRTKSPILKPLPPRVLQIPPAEDPGEPVLIDRSR